VDFREGSAPGDAAGSSMSQPCGSLAGGRLVAGLRFVARMSERPA
jgi:hypothetical protein